MLLAVDVYYYGDGAKAAGIMFNKWKDETFIQIVTAHIDKTEDYEPGAFYKRELPCIIKLLENVDTGQINVIVIDGYVYLDDQRKPGLGHYLYEYLNEKIPIIGAAKKPFHNNSLHVISLLRGKSGNPLYITSAGMDVFEAAEAINEMHGHYRIPMLLKLTDRQTRTI